MRDLELVGLSADGRQVLFVDETGAEFAAKADDRLRAALRGDRARLGQLEIQMESALRPRDIQARIRAGDSPEDVAALAQVPVERVMPYCLPVLAERQHIAETARRNHLRRKGSEAASRTLGEVTTERLRARGVDPRLVEWDAWRRDDGRWDVQASYLSGESSRTALFVYDAAGRYSFAEDDEAKWIAGEPQSTSKGPQPREPGQAAERRLAAVRDSDDDLLGLSGSPADDGDSDESADGDSEGDDLTAVARLVGDVDAQERPTDNEEAPDTQPDDPERSRPGITSFLDQALNRHHRPPEEEAPAAEAQPREETVEHAPGRKRRSKRAAVPSWDEIMFGKGESEEPGE